MMKRHIAVVVIGIALATPMTSYAEPAVRSHRPPGINAREQHQTGRITDGVRDRQLTRAELDRLRADQAAIRAKERVYRRSGEGLNRMERRDVESDLNKTSRQIYRAKHNRARP
ncbi:MAG: hypothetical protein ABI868_17565 [Acidobacteriota bacterium]